MSICKDCLHFSICSSEIRLTADTFRESLNQEPCRHFVNRLEYPEVVHCKDCQYYQDNNDGYPHPDCKWNNDETLDADDFCSAGERRNVNDKQR